MAMLKIVGGKSDVYEECTFSKYNLDLTTGCVTSLHGKEGRCQYCYARLWNYHDLKVKNGISRLDNQLKKLQDIEINGIKVGKWVRLGKMSDPGHYLTLPLLRLVLEKFKEYEVHPIIVTKLIDYHEDIAELIKESQGILHISLGYDELERGAAELGFDNMARVIVAMNYLNDNVPTVARVVLDVTAPPSRMYLTAKLNKLPILVTPLRFASRKIANKIGVDLSKYERYRGYYRPKWEYVLSEYKRMPMCGDLAGGVERCSLCLIPKFYKIKKLKKYVNIEPLGGS